MSKKRKSWQEKLADDKDLPKVVEITDKMSKRWGTSTVVIPAPREVAEKNHVQLRTDYGEEIFIVDVVKKEKFEHFFGLIEKDYLSFVNSINKLHFPEEWKTQLKTKIDREFEESKLAFPPEYYMIESEEENSSNAKR